MKSNTLRYALGGFLLGLIFPIFSWLLDGFFFNDYALSIDVLKKIHLDNSLHLIIDIVPFVLSFVFGIMGFYTDKLATVKTHQQNTTIYNKILFRRLRIGNTAFPILTIILLVISFFIIQQMTSSQQEDGKIINYAGRQRMLSQLIAKSSAYLILSENEDQEHYLTLLKESILELKNAHLSLTQKSNHLDINTSYTLSHNLRTKYKEIEPFYYGIASGVEEVIDSHKVSDSTERYRVARAALKKVEYNANAFLQHMNAIVLQYEQDSSKKNKNIRSSQFAILAALITIILIVSIFVLRPLRLRIQHAIEDVELAKQLIEENNQKLTESEKDALQRKKMLDESQRISKLVSYEIDIYTKEALWSDSFIYVFVITPEQMPSDTEVFLEWINNDDLDKINENWAKAITQKTEFNAIYRIKNPSDREFYIRERGYPIFDEQGRFIKMRGTLQDITTIELAHREVAAKNAYIEKQNNNFISSINYAQRIQSAMLGDTQAIQDIFKDVFILFEPRDVVSGDFYWFAQVGSKKIAIVGDCTGHGVPGAFMSLLGATILNEIILQRKITTPSEILDLLQIQISTILKQELTGNRDGMDMAIVVIDEATNTLEYAGARNPLVYFSNTPSDDENVDANIHLIKGDNLSIGGRNKKVLHDKFSNHVVPLHLVSVFYIFSDGFQDQFGGENGQKFLSKQFRRLLYTSSSDKMSRQRIALKRALIDWIGIDYAQTDDICVMGVRVN